MKTKKQKQIEALERHISDLKIRGHVIYYPQDKYRPNVSFSRDIGIHDTFRKLTRDEQIQFCEKHNVRFINGIFMLVPPKGEGGWDGKPLTQIDIDKAGLNERRYL